MVSTTECFNKHFLETGASRRSKGQFNDKLLLENFMNFASCGTFNKSLVANLYFQPVFLFFFFGSDRGTPPRTSMRKQAQNKTELSKAVACGRASEGLVVLAVERTCGANGAGQEGRWR